MDQEANQNIVDKQSNNNRNMTESSPNLTRVMADGAEDVVGMGEGADNMDQNYNMENQSTTSGSSVEPRSDLSYTDTEPNVTTNEDKSSELLLNAGRESVMSDYLATHMVPLPDLSVIATESEMDDDYMSVTSSAVGDSAWENNWLFKKKKPSLAGGSISTSSVGMLVPDPKEDVRAQIGDKTADEISDLSELGSDTDDSSMDLLRANLDPVSNRLFNKHVIGGQNSKMVLDELIERSSMISNTLPLDQEEAYAETRNVNVDAPSKNEAINTNVSQQNGNNNNNQEDQKNLEVLNPPMGFEDENSSSSNPLAGEDISDTEGCIGFSTVEVVEPPSERTPSVVEILAAMALGPMLAVPAADEPAALTTAELITMNELKNLALAEIKARSQEMYPHSLGVIPEELTEFDLKNFPTPEELEEQEQLAEKCLDKMAVLETIVETSDSPDKMEDNAGDSLSGEDSTDNTLKTEIVENKITKENEETKETEENEDKVLKTVETKEAEKKEMVEEKLCEPQNIPEETVDKPEEKTDKLEEEILEKREAEEAAATIAEADKTIRSQDLHEQISEIVENAATKTEESTEIVTKTKDVEQAGTATTEKDIETKDQQEKPSETVETTSTKNEEQNQESTENVIEIKEVYTAGTETQLQHTVSSETSEIKPEKEITSGTKEESAVQNVDIPECHVEQEIVDTTKSVECNLVETPSEKTQTVSSVSAVEEVPQTIKEETETSAQQAKLSEVLEAKLENLKENIDTEKAELTLSEDGEKTEAKLTEAGSSLQSENNKSDENDQKTDGTSSPLDVPTLETLAKLAAGTSENSLKSEQNSISDSGKGTLEKLQEEFTELPTIEFHIQTLPLNPLKKENKVEVVICENTEGSPEPASTTEPIKSDIETSETPKVETDVPTPIGDTNSQVIKIVEKAIEETTDKALDADSSPVQQIDLPAADEGEKITESETEIVEKVVSEVEISNKNVSTTTEVETQKPAPESQTSTVGDVSEKETVISDPEEKSGKEAEVVPQKILEDLGSTIEAEPQNSAPTEVEPPKESMNKVSIVEGEAKNLATTEIESQKSTTEEVSTTEIEPQNSIAEGSYATEIEKESASVEQIESHSADLLSTEAKPQEASEEKASETKVEPQKQFDEVASHNVESPTEGHPEKPVDQEVAKPVQECVTPTDSEPQKLIVEEVSSPEVENQIPTEKESIDVELEPQKPTSKETTKEENVPQNVAQQEVTEIKVEPLKSEVETPSEVEPQSGQEVSQAAVQPQAVSEESTAEVDKTDVQRPKSEEVNATNIESQKSDTVVVEEVPQAEIDSQKAADENETAGEVELQDATKTFKTPKIETKKAEAEIAPQAEISTINIDVVEETSSSDVHAQKATEVNKNATEEKSQEAAVTEKSEDEIVHEAESSAKPATEGISASHVETPVVESKEAKDVVEAPKDAADDTSSDPAVEPQSSSAVSTDVDPQNVATEVEDQCDKLHETPTIEAEVSKETVAPQESAIEVIKGEPQKEAVKEEISTNIGAQLETGEDVSSVEVDGTKSAVDNTCVGEVKSLKESLDTEESPKKDEPLAENPRENLSSKQEVNDVPSAKEEKTVQAVETITASDTEKVALEEIKSEKMTMEESCTKDVESAKPATAEVLDSEIKPPKATDDAESQNVNIIKSVDATAIGTKESEICTESKTVEDVKPVIATHNAEENVSESNASEVTETDEKEGISVVPKETKEESQSLTCEAEDIESKSEDSSIENSATAELSSSEVESNAATAVEPQSTVEDTKMSVESAVSTENIAETIPSESKIVETGTELSETLPSVDKSVTVGDSLSTETKEESPTTKEESQEATLKPTNPSNPDDSSQTLETKIETATETNVSPTSDSQYKETIDELTPKTEDTPSEVENKVESNATENTSEKGETKADAESVGSQTDGEYVASSKEKPEKPLDTQQDSPSEMPATTQKTLVKTIPDQSSVDKSTNTGDQPSKECKIMETTQEEEALKVSTVEISTSEEPQATEEKETPTQIPSSASSSQLNVGKLDAKEPTEENILAEKSQTEEDSAETEQQIKEIPSNLSLPLETPPTAVEVAAIEQVADVSSASKETNAKETVEEIANVAKANPTTVVDVNSSTEPTSETTTEKNVEDDNKAASEETPAVAKSDETVVIESNPNPTVEEPKDVVHEVAEVTASETSSIAVSQENVVEVPTTTDSTLTSTAGTSILEISTNPNSKSTTDPVSQGIDSTTQPASDIEQNSAKEISKETTSEKSVDAPIPVEESTASAVEEKVPTSKDSEVSSVTSKETPTTSETCSKELGSEQIPTALETSSQEPIPVAASEEKDKEVSSLSEGASAPVEKTTSLEVTESTPVAVSDDTVKEASDTCSKEIDDNVTTESIISKEELSNPSEDTSIDPKAVEVSENAIIESPTVSEETTKSLEVKDAPKIKKPSAEISETTIETVVSEKEVPSTVSEVCTPVEVTVTAESISVGESKEHTAEIPSATETFVAPAIDNVVTNPISTSADVSEKTTEEVSSVADSSSAEIVSESTLVTRSTENEPEQKSQSAILPEKNSEEISVAEETSQQEKVSEITVANVKSSEQPTSIKNESVITSNPVAEDAKPTSEIISAPIAEVMTPITPESPSIEISEIVEKVETHITCKSPSIDSDSEAYKTPPSELQADYQTPLESPNLQKSNIDISSLSPTQDTFSGSETEVTSAAETISDAIMTDSENQPISKEVIVEATEAPPTAGATETNSDAITDSENQPIPQEVIAEATEAPTTEGEINNNDITEVPLNANTAQKQNPREPSETTTLQQTNETNGENGKPESTPDQNVQTVAVEKSTEKQDSPSPSQEITQSDPQLSTEGMITETDKPTVIQPETVESFTSTAIPEDHSKEVSEVTAEKETTANKAPSSEGTVTAEKVPEASGSESSDIAPSKIEVKEAVASESPTVLEAPTSELLESKAAIKDIPASQNVASAVDESIEKETNPNTATSTEETTQAEKALESEAPAPESSDTALSKIDVKESLASDVPSSDCAALEAAASNPPTSEPLESEAAITDISPSDDAAPELTEKETNPNAIPSSEGKGPAEKAQQSEVLAPESLKPKASTSAVEASEIPANEALVSETPTSDTPTLEAPAPQPSESEASTTDIAATESTASKVDRIDISTENETPANATPSSDEKVPSEITQESAVSGSEVPSSDEALSKLHVTEVLASEAPSSDSADSIAPVTTEIAPALEVSESETPKPTSVTEALASEAPPSDSPASEVPEPSEASTGLETAASVAPVKTEIAKESKAPALEVSESETPTSDVAPSDKTVMEALASEAPTSDSPASEVPKPSEASTDIPTSVNSSSGISLPDAEASKEKPQPVSDISEVPASKAMRSGDPVSEVQNIPVEQSTASEVPVSEIQASDVSMSEAASVSEVPAKAEAAEVCVSGSAALEAEVLDSSKAPETEAPIKTITPSENTTSEGSVAEIPASVPESTALKQEPAESLGSAIPVTEAQTLNAPASEASQAELKNPDTPDEQHTASEVLALGAASMPDVPAKAEVIEGSILEASTSAPEASTSNPTEHKAQAETKPLEGSEVKTERESESHVTSHDEDKIEVANTAEAESSEANLVAPASEGSESVAATPEFASSAETETPALETATLATSASESSEVEAPTSGTTKLETSETDTKVSANSKSVVQAQESTTLSKVSKAEDSSSESPALEVAKLEATEPKIPTSESTTSENQAADVSVSEISMSEIQAPQPSALEAATPEISTNVTSQESVPVPDIEPAPTSEAAILDSPAQEGGKLNESETPALGSEPEATVADTSESQASALDATSTEPVTSENPGKIEASKMSTSDVVTSEDSVSEVAPESVVSTEEKTVLTESSAPEVPTSDLTISEPLVSETLTPKPEDPKPEDPTPKPEDPVSDVSASEVSESEIQAPEVPASGDSADKPISVPASEVLKPENIDTVPSIEPASTSEPAILDYPPLKSETSDSAPDATKPDTLESSTVPVDKSISAPASQVPKPENIDTEFSMSKASKESKASVSEVLASDAPVPETPSDVSKPEDIHTDSSIPKNEFSEVSETAVLKSEPSVTSMPADSTLTASSTDAAPKETPNKIESEETVQEYPNLTDVSSKLQSESGDTFVRDSEKQETNDAVSSPETTASADLTTAPASTTSEIQESEAMVATPPTEVPSTDMPSQTVLPSSSSTEKVLAESLVAPPADVSVKDVSEESNQEAPLPTPSSDNNEKRIEIMQESPPSLTDEPVPTETSKDNEEVVESLDIVVVKLAEPSEIKTGESPPSPSTVEEQTMPPKTTVDDTSVPNIPTTDVSNEASQTTITSQTSDTPVNTEQPINTPESSSNAVINETLSSAASKEINKSDVSALTPNEVSTSDNTTPTSLMESLTENTQPPVGSTNNTETESAPLTTKSLDPNLCEGSTVSHDLTTAEEAKIPSVDSDNCVSQSEEISQVVKDQSPNADSKTETNIVSESKEIPTAALPQPISTLGETTTETVEKVPSSSENQLNSTPEESSTEPKESTNAKDTSEINNPTESASSSGKLVDPEACKSQTEIVTKSDSLLHEAPSCDTSESKTTAIGTASEVSPVQDNPPENQEQPNKLDDEGKSGEIVDSTTEESKEVGTLESSVARVESDSVVEIPQPDEKLEVPSLETRSESNLPKTEESKQDTTSKVDVESPSLTEDEIKSVSSTEVPQQTATVSEVDKSSSGPPETDAPTSTELAASASQTETKDDSTALPQEKLVTVCDIKTSETKSSEPEGSEVPNTKTVVPDVSATEIKSLEESKSDVSVSKDSISEIPVLESSSSETAAIESLASEAPASEITVVESQASQVATLDISITQVSASQTTSSGVLVTECPESEAHTLEITNAEMQASEGSTVLKVMLSQNSESEIASSAKEVCPVVASEAPGLKVTVLDVSISEIPVSETSLSEVPVSEDPVSDTTKLETQASENSTVLKVSVSQTSEPETLSPQVPPTEVIDSQVVESVAPALEVIVLEVSIAEVPASEGPISQAQLSEITNKETQASETSVLEVSISQVSESDTTSAEVPIAESAATGSEAPALEVTISEVSISEVPLSETSLPEVPASECPLLQAQASETTNIETQVSKATVLEVSISQISQLETSSPGVPEPDTLSTNLLNSAVSAQLETSSSEAAVSEEPAIEVIVSEVVKLDALESESADKESQALEATAAEVSTSEFPVSETSSSKVAISKTSPSEVPLSETSSSEVPVSETLSSEVQVSKAQASEITNMETQASEVTVLAPVSESELPISETLSTEVSISSVPRQEVNVSEVVTSGTLEIQVSTTETPSAEAPVSDTPATRISVSKSADTKVSETVVPTSETPSSEALVSDTPAKEAPVSESPETKASATVVPTSETPSSEALVSDTPAKKAPASESAETKASATVVPPEEVLVSEASEKEVLPPEVSATEALVSDTPAKEAPVSESPETKASATVVPPEEVLLSEASEEVVLPPEVSATETPVSEVSVPEAPISQVAISEVSNPQTTKTEIAEVPKVSELIITKSELLPPEVSESQIDIVKSVVAPQEHDKTEADNKKLESTGLTPEETAEQLEGQSSTSQLKVAQDMEMNVPQESSANVPEETPSTEAAETEKPAVSEITKEDNISNGSPVPTQEIIDATESKDKTATDDKKSSENISEETVESSSSVEPKEMNEKVALLEAELSSVPPIAADSSSSPQESSTTIPQQTITEPEKSTTAQGEHNPKESPEKLTPIEAGDKKHLEAAKESTEISEDTTEPTVQLEQELALTEHSAVSKIAENISTPQESINKLHEKTTASLKSVLISVAPKDQNSLPNEPPTVSNEKVPQQQTEKEELPLKDEVSDESMANPIESIALESQETTSTAQISAESATVEEISQPQTDSEKIPAPEKVSDDSKEIPTESSPKEFFEATSNVPQQVCTETSKNVEEESQSDPIKITSSDEGSHPIAVKNVQTIPDDNKSEKNSAIPQNESESSLSDSSVTLPQGNLTTETVPICEKEKITDDLNKKVPRTDLSAPEVCSASSAESETIQVVPKETLESEIKIAEPQTTAKETIIASETESSGPGVCGVMTSSANIETALKEQVDSKKASLEATNAIENDDTPVTEVCPIMDTTQTEDSKSLQDLKVEKAIESLNNASTSQPDDHISLSRSETIKISSDVAEPTSSVELLLETETEVPASQIEEDTVETCEIVTSDLPRSVSLAEELAEALQATQDVHSTVEPVEEAKSYTKEMEADNTKEPSDVPSDIPGNKSEASNSSCKISESSIPLSKISAASELASEISTQGEIKQNIEESSTIVEESVISASETSEQQESTDHSSTIVSEFMLTSCETPGVVVQTSTEKSTCDVPTSDVEIPANEAAPETSEQKVPTDRSSTIVSGSVISTFETPTLDVQTSPEKPTDEFPVSKVESAIGQQASETPEQKESAIAEAVISTCETPSELLLEQNESSEHVSTVVSESVVSVFETSSLDVQTSSEKSTDDVSTATIKPAVNESASETSEKESADRSSAIVLESVILTCVTPGVDVQMSTEKLADDVPTSGVETTVIEPALESSEMKETEKSLTISSESVISIYEKPSADIQAPNESPAVDVSTSNVSEPASDQSEQKESTDHSSTIASHIVISKCGTSSEVIQSSPKESTGDIATSDVETAVHEPTTESSELKEIKSNSETSTEKSSTIVSESVVSTCETPCADIQDSTEKPTVAVPTSNVESVVSEPASEPCEQKESADYPSTIAPQTEKSSTIVSESAISTCETPCADIQVSTEKPTVDVPTSDVESVVSEPTSEPYEQKESADYPSTTAVNAPDSESTKLNEIKNNVEASTEKSSTIVSESVISTCETPCADVKISTEKPTVDVPTSAVESVVSEPTSEPREQKESADYPSTIASQTVAQASNEVPTGDAPTSSEGTVVNEPASESSEGKQIKSNFEGSTDKSPAIVSESVISEHKTPSADVPTSNEYPTVPTSHVESAISEPAPTATAEIEASNNDILPIGISPDSEKPESAAVEKEIMKNNEESSTIVSESVIPPHENLSVDDPIPVTDSSASLEISECSQDQPLPLGADEKNVTSTSSIADGRIRENVEASTKSSAQIISQPVPPPAESLTVGVLTSEVRDESCSGNSDIVLESPEKQISISTASKEEISKKSETTKMCLKEVCSTTQLISPIQSLDISPETITSEDKSEATLPLSSAVQDIAATGFPSGSIAEREYKKWYNAVEMPNNPYAPEALKRRISGSQERFIDLPNINASTDPSPLEMLTKEKVEADEANQRENEYRRYSRDYYINDGSAKSSQISSPVRDTVAASSKDVTEIKPKAEQTPATLTVCGTESQQPTETGLYKAIPAEVLMVEDNTTTSSSSLDTMSQQSLQSSVGATTTVTTSDDSDTIKIYNFKKQQTTTVSRDGAKEGEVPACSSDTTKKEEAAKDSSEVTTTKERPTMLNISRQESTTPLSTGTTPTRGSTPPAFKFLQPKRKLLNPSQVLSQDEDEEQPSCSQVPEKPVIEKEVVHALPSVKALARAFLMTTSTSQHSAERIWPRKAKSIPGQSKTPTKSFVKPIESPKADIDKSEEDTTIASDLSSLETDPSSAGKTPDDTKDQIKSTTPANTPTTPTAATATTTTSNPPTTPSPVRQGVLKSNIAFFENLKYK
ncbi:myosin-7a binding protein isoform X6 [Musca autumnalis]|uniref:myosin-7a binding protein isoform X6 n=1 Tax=Musca autumnalis TaxID=221902 RepID=UPI003CF4578B